MVDYRLKFNIDFDLSEKQIEILERVSDTIVRAVPGSGKTTILTLKIEKLLTDNQNINKLCCISYTNVNVEDLENSCISKIDNNLISKIDFLTFHGFCLNYILNPFSYLYKNSKGFRPYKEIFDYKIHGVELIDFLKKSNIDEIDISQISEKESIYYNFKYKKNRWTPIGSTLSQNTLIEYLHFLNVRKLIDFNLINLLSLFIIQDNKFVRIALNKSIDWILIDEFQDVTDIQCKIIEELRRGRQSDVETKWFLVGDPNQSIYGFAGANPSSMYDIKKIFNSFNEEGVDCEIKLDRTHRCSDKVFNFARKNYNNILSKVINLVSSKDFSNTNVLLYLEDLKIGEYIKGSDGSGDVIIRSTVSGVSEIVNLRINELINDDVCCVGINKFNSIDVYRQYKTLVNSDIGDDFKLYSEIYKDFENEYGFKYFSIFISYLILKHNFFNNRVRYISSLNKFIYYLNQFIYEKILDDNYSDEKVSEILINTCCIDIPFDINKNLSDEFNEFSFRLSECLQNSFPGYENIFKINIKSKNFDNITVPVVSGFINFISKISNSKSSFEIKHIHKIKGLEYDQVIVQKTEDLPHKSNYKINGAIFYQKHTDFTEEEVYNYIQEMNKLYVMLTRAKINLYLIINDNHHPLFIELSNSDLLKI